MISKYRMGIFLASILTAGLFFLAIPDSSHAGSLFGGPPCCEIDIPEQGPICVGGEEAFSACEQSETCAAFECQLFEGSICEPLDDSEEFGICRQILLERNIPTLGEWGLIALVAVLGAAGYIVLRRRKSPA